MGDFISAFLASDLRVATPILLAALGILFSEKAGIVNIGVDGLMLIGAFMGVYGSYVTGNAVLGTLIAMAVCTLFALVFAFFTITIRADQTVVGMAINIFASGLTITLNRIVFGVSTAVPKLDVFKPVAIPGLSKIPVLGDALFNQCVLVYIAFLLVPVAAWVLKRTSLGLNIRAVGNNPVACATMGVNVIRTRYATVLFSGAMAGVAGAFCSMGQVSFFTEGMVAGRGFMALAAVVFGNYKASGVLAAVLIFGAGDALSYRLQAMNLNLPYQLLVALPYIITVVALCAFSGKSNQPASSGIPYKKD